MEASVDNWATSPPIVWIRHASRAVCALAFAAALAACGSTTNPTSADDVYDNSYEGGPADLESVKHEYNADLADLRELLDQASSYEDQVIAMEPIDQYSQYEVDTYNNLVSRYTQLPMSIGTKLELSTKNTSRTQTGPKEPFDQP